MKIYFKNIKLKTENAAISRVSRLVGRSYLNPSELYEETSSCYISSGRWSEEMPHELRSTESDKRPSRNSYI